MLGVPLGAGRSIPPYRPHREGPSNRTVMMRGSPGPDGSTVRRAICRALPRYAGAGKGGSPPGQSQLSNERCCSLRVIVEAPARRPVGPEHPADLRRFFSRPRRQPRVGIEVPLVPDSALARSWTASTGLAGATCPARCGHRCSPERARAPAHCAARPLTPAAQSPSAAGRGRSSAAIGSSKVWPMAHAGPCT